MATVRKSQPASAALDLLRSPSLPVLLILCAVAIGVAALLPLVQSSDLTATNGNIQRLERDSADWRARLHEMELDVARMSSLERVEKEARERLSMAPPTETHYISVDEPPPQESRLPSRYLPPPVEEPRAGSSLWDKLFGWIPLP